MNPIAALVLTGLAITGGVVLLGSYIDGQRKQKRALLERQLMEAQQNGDCAEIARLLGELRAL